MKYEVTKIGKKKVCIIETKTNQVIRVYKNNNKNMAYQLCQHLNKSGGFQGETPAYFLKKEEQSSLTAS